MSVNAIIGSLCFWARTSTPNRRLVILVSHRDAPLIFMPMDRESKPRLRPLPVPRPPCAEVLTLRTSTRRTFLVVFVMTIGLVVE